MKTIFLAALKEETPALNKFHHTGVGKINATMKLMELINLYKPTQVINYGTAGSFKREISGLVECTTFVQHDMDARGLLDFKLGETPFDPISKIILSDKGYICATGDRFVKNKLEINCDIVDMECYSLAYVCKQRDIMFKSFKWVSDDGDIDKWEQNAAIGFENFSNKLINLLKK